MLEVLSCWKHCYHSAKKHGLLLIAFSVLVSNALAQQQTGKVDSIGKKVTHSRKGRFFFYWGYNRDGYSKSDIHINGNGYSFSITDVKAHDEQTTLSNTYIGLTSLTTPQYNYRLGYYINNNTFITLGQDHMKYRITKQATYLTGYINNDNNGGKNIGTYNNTEVLVGEAGYNPTQTITGENSLKDGFVSNFENCDGLNDISAEIGKAINLWTAKNGKQSADATAAIGGGIEMVDTDAKILGYTPKHNYGNGKTYHLAGYSCSAVIGTEFYFLKNFFLEARLKGGFVNLPDMNTTIDGGKANQHFWFIEFVGAAGFSLTIGK